MPKRSPTIVDVDWRPALLAQAEGWEAEARKMEIAIDESGALYGHSGGTDENADASVGDSKSENARPDFLPIEIDLGQLLLKTDKFSMGSKSSRKQLEQQLREWDKSRDGSISKGEFRLHLRKLGLPHPYHEVDALFDKYDADRSGSMDMDELRDALLRLKATIQLHFRADEAKREERAKVDAIRTRATHAREAIACANRADRCEAQLLALKQDYASRLDLQLGLLLVQRGITLAHIAANWPKPRGTHNKDHVHDVSKEEFKDEVQALGLQVAVFPADGADKGGELASSRAAVSNRAGAALSSRRGTTRRTGAAALGRTYQAARPVNRKEVGALFDKIDTDKSGWLSLKELKEALKAWMVGSREALAEQQVKEQERAQHRRRAASMLQASLRVQARTAMEPEEFNTSTVTPTPGTSPSAGEARGGTKQQAPTANTRKQQQSIVQRPRAPELHLLEMPAKPREAGSTTSLSRRSSKSSRRSSKSSGQPSR